jgi:hypothetical protein
VAPGALRFAKGAADPCSMPLQMVPCLFCCMHTVKLCVVHRLAIWPTIIVMQSTFVFSTGEVVACYNDMLTNSTVQTIQHVANQTCRDTEIYVSERQTTRTGCALSKAVEARNFVQLCSRPDCWPYVLHLQLKVPTCL